MCSWSGGSYRLRAPSSWALDTGTRSVSVSSCFMLKHWTAWLLISLSSPSLVSLFPCSSFLQDMPLLLSDHGLSVTVQQGFMLYKEGIQYLQPWSLFLASYLFTFTSYVKSAVLNASYLGVNRILGHVPLTLLGHVPLTLLHSGVDIVVIWKGTTQLSPLTGLTSTDKVWN